MVSYAAQDVQYLAQMYECFKSHFDSINKIDMSQQNDVAECSTENELSSSDPEDLATHHSSNSSCSSSKKMPAKPQQKSWFDFF